MKTVYTLNSTLYLLSCFIFISGCATIDKGLAPIDNAINSTKATYSSASNSSNEVINNLANNINGLESGFYESSLVKLFSDDETILKNRDKNFVKWNGSSNYDYKTIIEEYFKKNNLTNLKEKNLVISQKMNILKEYFFEILKNEHTEKFKNEHKKVEFDKFLTDRENIYNIYEYKAALVESEHQWMMKLHDTQKKVAQLMLSTMFSTPKIKFISYDPDDEEIYLSIVSKYNGFEEKIKFKIEKEAARTIENNIINIMPNIYFKFNDNSLEFVGVSALYNNKTYLCELIDTAYVRERNVVFTSDNLSLNDEDVNYTEIVKNIVPPKWYLKENEKNIAYGQGKDEEEAKNDAYKNIAQSIKVTINSEISSEDSVNGSILSTTFNSKSTQKVESVAIEGSKIKKFEKKDGIWFVAIAYNL